MNWSEHEVDGGNEVGLKCWARRCPMQAFRTRGTLALMHNRLLYVQVRGRMVALSTNEVLGEVGGLGVLGVTLGACGGSAENS